MFKSNIRPKKWLGLAGVGLLLASFAACGPAPTQQAVTQSGSLKAVSISEISPSDNKVTIGLAWGTLPSTARSVTFFRREDGQPDSAAIQIATETDMLKNSITDTDARLMQGKRYVYNMRADGERGDRVAAAKSDPVDVISAEEVKNFNLLVPAKNDELLKDLGTGIEFSWEDAGTNLYYISVSNLSGQIQWAALTNKTSISYGTESAIPVPQALTQKLSISRSVPDSRRNEVRYAGVGKGGTYKVTVKAISTKPEAAKLDTAQAVAIRTTKEITFLAQ